MAELQKYEGNRSIHKLVTLVLELGAEDTQRSARSFARTQVLLQAMAVFNQRGLEETSVQDLLDSANISRRTFYKYFSGKLDVLENIFKLASDVLLVRFKSELSDAQTIDEICTRVISIYFDYQFSMGKIIGLMMEEAIRSASPLAPHRITSMNAVTDVLVNELARVGSKTPQHYYIRSLLWALEGASLYILTQAPEESRTAELLQARQEMLQLWKTALAK